MAILRPTDEELANLPEEQPIMVDSDAENNAHAIQEIERWCRARGLVRAQENWLRTLRTEDGTLVRRGICYKPSGDARQARREVFEETVRTVADSPATASSVDILRQD